MNAEEYLNIALGGNMNISTLKPLAWHEIMEGYAKQKLLERSDNSDSAEITTKCSRCIHENTCQTVFGSYDCEMQFKPV
jgi:hypothetical protein